MKDAFKQPGFATLFTALTVSMIGDSIMLLVFSMWVKDLTQSNGLAGLTFLFVVIPSIFAVFLGVFIDRMPRRTILMWGHVAMGAAMLPLLLVHDRSQLWIIWAVAFCYGVSMVVIPAALNGMLKEMIPDEVLAAANGAVQTVREALRLVGPLLGAWIYSTVGPGMTAMIDAASFFIAGAIILAVPAGTTAAANASHDFLTEITQGVRHLRTETILKHVVVGFFITLLVLGFFESMIYAILDAFDKPTEFVGILVTFQGLGAAVGAVTASRWIKRFGEVTVTVAGLALIAFATLGIAVTTTVSGLLAASVVEGFGIPPMLVAFNTLVQRRTPDTIIGRVSTAVETLLGVPQAISIGVGAALVSVVPYRYAMLGIAAVVGISAVYVGVMLRDYFGEVHSADPPAEQNA